MASQLRTIFHEVVSGPDDTNVTDHMLKQIINCLQYEKDPHYRRNILLNIINEFPPPSGESDDTVLSNIKNNHYR